MNKKFCKQIRQQVAAADLPALFTTTTSPARWGEVEIKVPVNHYRRAKRLAAKHGLGAVTEYCRSLYILPAPKHTGYVQKAN